jgi:hypothetical protein
MMKRVLFCIAPVALLSGCSGAPAQSSPDEANRTLTASVEAEAASLRSVAPNRAIDVSLNLLTRVVTDTGSVLEFYEPSPGDILVSEAGSDGATPSRALSRDLSASAAYHAVAPGLPVPAKLLAAETRLAALTSTASERPPVDKLAVPATPLSKPAHGVVRPFAVDPNSYCGRQWFINNISDAHHNCIDGFGNYQWCMYDTGPGAWANCNNLVADEAELCVANGDNISLKVNRQGDDNSGGNWSVPAPGWRTFWHLAGSNIFGFTRYNAQINVNGNWGDVQFAGDFTY